MKHRMRNAWIALVAGLMWTVIAHFAYAVDFEWLAPTTYEDDTPLTVADLAEYSLICQGATFTYPGDVMMSMEDFAPGTYICTMTVTATNGLTSAPSDSVSFTVAPPPSPPNPVILSVTN